MTEEKNCPLLPTAEGEDFVRRGYLGNLINRLIPRRETATPESEASRPKRPFLSIITRTQGRRLDSLREVFLCLASQTDLDFEVLVMGHRLGAESTAVVKEIIAENPAWLRERMRYVPVEGGNRTTPLNAGFAAANGHYIAILDDDETIFAHWVETFHELSKTHPGFLLRAVALQQDIERVTIQGRDGLRAVSQLKPTFPVEFDYIDQCRINATPPVSVAFPREAFHLLDIKLDEALTTTEDWDIIMRVANLCGVACAKEATSIYRYWPKAESSYTVHPHAEWEKNHHYIWDKMDQDYLILPPGSAAKIRDLLEENHQTKADNKGLLEELQRLHRAITANPPAGHT